MAAKKRSVFVWVCVLVVAIAVALGVLLRVNSRVNLPAHLLSHPCSLVSPLLSPSTADTLIALTKKFAPIPCLVSDLKFYRTLHEHIGEAVPIGADGKCAHPFLTPNINRTLCVLPGRVDVGRHFVMTGGVEGKKEKYEVSVSRLHSFGRYMFDLSEYPVVEELFGSPSFQQSAKSVCPPRKQFLDPFQFNFIIQVPGQSVALHIDAPYFWGATRFQYPQWLLAAMVFSGLFKSQFVDQVQVVAYYHRWNHTGRGGEFVYWDENVAHPQVSPPVALAGSCVDGSKVVHAASIYRPETLPPVIDKSKEVELRYVGDDVWQVVSDGEVLNKYSTDDLRMTVVYRARCFADAKEAALFRHFVDTNEGTLSLDVILDTFVRDLRDRGRRVPTPSSPSHKLSPQETLELAMLIMDEYIKYPLPPDAIVPYNYCALSKLAPWLSPIVDLIC